MRIIAVDDERLALELIVRLLQKLVPEAEVKGFSKSSEAFAYLSEYKPDIAVLDIHMAGMNGIELAKKCKDLCPTINIIFVTGYSQYAIDAHKLHASGFLMKPVREEDLLAELENLRYPLSVRATSRIRIQTFGNFEIFVEGEPVQFPRSKCKECLAYLVDRRGVSVTAAEIAATLWEDKPYDRSLQKQVQSIIWHMMQSLRNVGAEHIVNKQRNSIALNIQEFYCDYYQLLKMDMEAINSYMGEYMRQYSWAEMTVAAVWEKIYR